VWRSLLAVAVGGVLGTAARWGVDTLIPHATPGSLAVSTVVVNVVGSFVLGLLVASLWTRARVPMWLKAGVGTGILGSFTTFSAVALNVVASAVEANVLAMLGALVLSTVFGLLAAWGGLALGRKLTGHGTSHPATIPDGGINL
jgi:CrcB protein